MATNPFYVAKRAAALTNPTSATVFKTNDDATKAAVVYLPGHSKMDGKSFLIRCAGKATSGTTTNLTIAIMKGSSLTVGSDTAFATSGALAINSASGNFNVEVRATLDSTSKIIQGFVEGHVNATAITQAACTPVTAQDPTGTAIPFVATAVFSGSDAGNTVSITEFSISEG